MVDYICTNGVNQTKAAKFFDNKWPGLCIKQPTISSWLKQEVEISEQFSQNLQEDLKNSGILEGPKNNEILELWISQCMSHKMLLTGEILRQKWKIFAAFNKEDEAAELKFSNGWLDSMKVRTNLKHVKRYGEGQSISVDHANQERARSRTIFCDFQPIDIFNLDKTGLFYVMLPSKSLTSRTNINGIKTSKIGLTYAFTCNMNGSERLVSFFVGKGHKPHCFGKKTGKELGFYYRHNATAWITSEFFTEWLKDWDRVCREKGRKIILLSSNFLGHTCQTTLTDNAVEKFDPNMASNIQTMDAGIIACSKARYIALFHRRAIKVYDNKALVDPNFIINHREAMRLAEIAWNMVTEAKLANFFRKTGILPVEIYLSVITESKSPLDIIKRVLKI